MHPGYSANIELICSEGELDRNPALKALLNAIEDAVQTYIASGPKSVEEINIAVGPHDVITQLFVVDFDGRTRPFCTSPWVRNAASTPTAPTSVCQ